MIRSVSYFVLLGLISCASKLGTTGFSVSDEFKNQWSSGKAELNWFDLSQARYGEMHHGHAVVIFVKEKVDSHTFIKLNDDSQEGTEVLKCNFIRKFSTGVYDYAVMQTMMTAIEGPLSGTMLKSSLSVQDWCGHVNTSIQMEGNKWAYHAQSYFEGETMNRDVPLNTSEDGLLNQIRINPTSLPKGKIKLLPSLLYLRLRHQELKAEEAEINLNVIDSKNSKLEIVYSKIVRKVEITFTTAFPHEIQSISESYPSGWGENEKVLTTSMSQVKSDWLPYWDLHNLPDSTYRPAGLKGYSK